MEEAFDLVSFVIEECFDLTTNLKASADQSFLKMVMAEEILIIWPDSFVAFGFFSRSFSAKGILSLPVSFSLLIANSL